MYKNTWIGDNYMQNLSERHVVKRSLVRCVIKWEVGIFIYLKGKGMIGVEFRCSGIEFWVIQN
jgi:hypothetical protein